MWRVLLASAPLGAVTATDSGYITSAEATRTFAWTDEARSVADALELTFPRGAGWADACFEEGGCGDGRVVTLASLGEWVENELLPTTPFSAHGGEVPVPWPAEEGLGDQLGDGQFVGYSRRQVCFVAAKALLGADTDGYANGLTRIMRTTVAHCASPIPSVPRPEGYEPSALTGDFGMTLWKLLAACSADPSLADGAQGPMILVARGRQRPEVEEVRRLAADAPLADARLSVCRYDDGDAGPVSGSGLQEMPAGMCTPPTTGAPGTDFMTGGRSRVKGQAIQDISAKFLGGYLFGNACGLGGGQDERLMTYFPEVFTLAFFLSQDSERPQLREPAWVLGARLLMIGLDGTGRFDERLQLDAWVPMTSDLVDVDVPGYGTYAISSTAPFLAFMSENQDFLGEGKYPSERSFAEMHHILATARQNRNPLQRKVDADTWYSFMYQVRAWYSAVALTSYSAAVQPALKAVVKTLGTGPFLAGLWWGDSQLGFLTVWIAQALAAKTWGDAGLPVQYYIYADFTENPGNQCFVHSLNACEVCLSRCADDPLPKDAYWLPDYAFMGPGENKSCVVDSEQYCGARGIKEIVSAAQHMKAGDLWALVEDTIGPETTDKTVFDLLWPALPSTVSSDFVLP